jgi:hypothetical protein
MLLNPYRIPIQVLPGSRILTETLGLLGVSIQDPAQAGRQWMITNLYGPIQGRSLGGIRAKLQDDKGFITFCNQRDLEMLIGLATPGNLCPWTSSTYPEWDSPEFFGLCADEDDLRDDLFDRELALRAQQPGVIPFGQELERRIHTDTRRDHEDLYTMLYDCDPQSGYGPDPRFKTLSRRWTRVQRENVTWAQL